MQGRNLNPDVKSVGITDAELCIETTRLWKVKTLLQPGVCATNEKIYWSNGIIRKMNFHLKTIHMEANEEFGGNVPMAMNGWHKLNRAPLKVMVVNGVDI